MFAPVTILLLIIFYVLILFWLAFHAEKREMGGNSLVNNPYVYSLSLAVYCTSWTFYGSVGRGASQGLSFLPIYLGATITAILMPVLLVKIIRVAKANRLSNIPDFISARYGNSLPISVIATLITVIGIIPYIALQIKAITSSFAIVSGKADWGASSSLAITLMLGLFTIVFGARRLDSTEKHGGLVFAIAFESIVKLIAFILVGIFVVYYLFDGMGDIMETASDFGINQLLFVGDGASVGYLDFFSITLLSMSGIIFLPRQFQMAVVENSNESHVMQASWLLPAYLFTINLFVIPIAFAGLLTGGSASQADYFVLNLPFGFGNRYLALIVFIGGFSAATGMVIVETLALSTMVMNSLITPALVKLRHISNFTGIVLNIKRSVIMLIILISYLFTISLGKLESLVEIGVKSFEAIAIFAPLMIFSIFWKKGNHISVISALCAGFSAWFYTAIVPLLLKAHLLDAKSGLGYLTTISYLDPNALFGVTGLGKSTHTLFWILVLELSAFLILSFLIKENAAEVSQGEIFVDFEVNKQTEDDSVLFEADRIEEILSRYIDQESVARSMKSFMLSIGKDYRSDLTVSELNELKEYAERTIAGVVGASLAAAIFETESGGR